MLMYHKLILLRPQKITTPKPLKTIFFFKISKSKNILLVKTSIENSVNLQISSPTHFKPQKQKNNIIKMFFLKFDYFDFRFEKGFNFNNYKLYYIILYFIIFYNKYGFFVFWNFIILISDSKKDSISTIIHLRCFEWKTIKLCMPKERVRALCIQWQFKRLIKRWWSLLVTQMLLPVCSRLLCAQLENILTALVTKKSFHFRSNTGSFRSLFPRNGGRKLAGGKFIHHMPDEKINYTSYFQIDGILWRPKRGYLCSLYYS